MAKASVLLLLALAALASVRCHDQHAEADVTVQSEIAVQVATETEVEGPERTSWNSWHTTTGGEDGMTYTSSSTYSYSSTTIRPPSYASVSAEPEPEPEEPVQNHRIGFSMETVRRARLYPLSFAPPPHPPAHPTLTGSLPPSLSTHLPRSTWTRVCPSLRLSSTSARRSGTLASASARPRRRPSPS